MGCTYERKRLAGTDCVGCTCDRKQFRRIIVFFSSTVRISVFERSPVAHDAILPNVCARRAYPRRFLGRVGRTPLLPTLTWRWFQMPSRKGVLNRLFRTDAHQCLDAQFGTPYPRSAGFATDIGAFIESSSLLSPFRPDGSFDHQQ